MKTILVIDNDIALRENICGFLKGEGYDFLSADDGYTGLQQAISFLPDLIICEIVMPGMNGYEFYKTIQQIRSTSVIPLIFVTGHSEKEDFRAAMNLGVDDYITKPIDYSELLFSIQTRFEKHKKLRQHNNDKLHALINNPLTGVFIYSNKFDFVNDKCVNIFGMTSDDFSGLTFNSLIIGNDKDMVLDRIERCFGKEQNTLHTSFHAHHLKRKHEVKVEMYVGYVNFKGADSLVGYMTECVGENEVRMS